jgi:hypothetical protein
MSGSVLLTKAELQELDEKGQLASDKSHLVKVQFNPETLKVSLSNQVVPPENQKGESGGQAVDQRGNAAIQYVGKGATKLSVQLWFDVTAETGEGEKDVQELTKKVVYFITPKSPDNDPKKLIPPGVRFAWGTFQFDGIMESMEESLEYFSAEGVPLRASVTINLSKQEINWVIGKSTSPMGGAASPGSSPLSQARDGDSLQMMAANSGKLDLWQAIAQANNIENPRLLWPGQRIDLNLVKSD